MQCAFNGLVSIDQFNRANKGKKFITKDDQGDIVIIDRPPDPRYAIKGIRNPDFPYRKFVLCPQCHKPLLGSASRGKSGKHYPAYHCDKRGHYWLSNKNSSPGWLSLLAAYEYRQSKLTKS